MLQLELLDAKMTSGNWRKLHSTRTQGGLNNAVRLALRELGIKPVDRTKKLSVPNISPLETPKKGEVR